ncbi:phosphonate C-P lyase system protein PhnG [Aestuariibius sp. 2305UL40-4]|uniref:phosphonate C-P lyase system protein PhnG n=1 Tax=Aestuariibius violaceus TaxID=3234132 RepID=UPI00345E0E56
MAASAQEQRRNRLSALAKAPADRLQALWSKIGEEPEHRLIRGPEFGSVMVRGRAGGTGAPFNLGEVTVTRCSVALADGTVGHGYVQGRSAAAARIVALADALAEAGQHDLIEAGLVAPLEEERVAKRKARARKAAATKVDFFTMVRGEAT